MLKPMKATLGGAIHPSGPVKGYEHIAYVWIDLGDGTTLALFFNRETRLLVAEVSCLEGGGHEFVRTSAPRLSEAFRRGLEEPAGDLCGAAL